MSSAMPPTPTQGRMSLRSLPSSSPSPHSSTSLRRNITASGLPPPPVVTGHTAGQSQFAQSISKSLTIEEMRELHQRALSDAEAKRTELRLVLASRYRELVGSSDEVQKMRERAQELNELVHALPSYMQKLVKSTEVIPQDPSAQSSDNGSKVNELDFLRRNLSVLPRMIHRNLDKNDVHGATVCIIQLFKLIARQSKDYPLASALASDVSYEPNPGLDLQLKAKMKMIFLYTQTLPEKIVRLSKRILLTAASYGSNVKEPAMGAQLSASALSALDLLDVQGQQDRAVHLLDLYFDSKAQLLQSLLTQLVTPGTSTKEDPNNSDMTEDNSGAQNAEEILSKIVLILQHDVIVHPYQIFCLESFPVEKDGQVQEITRSLPKFDKEMVKSRSSSFLAAHLPLIRTKVKSILVSIAGTTASALGKIRQSLYDKTDGVECMERLDSNGCCTWEEAVQGTVDIGTVRSHGGFSESTNNSDALTNRRFSLWSSLFSNTFSSLVHSLLSSSFHSVHSRVVSTLHTSLASAPPVGLILPHEAYRNTLRIATELDEALLKVSEDAHELLVHAEERVESERRLRLSLYVQTCEIMGRLVLELRRMLLRVNDDKSDATKELIVGRLCYLLKFRLTSLPTLLNPKSSPAVSQSSSGMISLIELQAAFELADDNDDGLITFEEAMEAVDSAFSGTQFHGAEMVRETLLLSSTEKDSQPTSGALSPVAPVNVTLNELALLTARGLRHELTGSASALGTVQKSLDNIVEICFQEWARATIAVPFESITKKFKEFLHVACTTSDLEWQRIHNPAEGSSIQSVMTAKRDAATSSDPTPNKVSPHVAGYLLDVSVILNRTVFPSDTYLPIYSPEYASSLGLVFEKTSDIPTMKDTIQWALLRQALYLFTSGLSDAFDSLSSAQDNGEQGTVSLESSGPSALAQLKTDISFIMLCFCGDYATVVKELRSKFKASKPDNKFESSQTILEKALADTDSKLQDLCEGDSWDSLVKTIPQLHQNVMEDSELFLSALFSCSDSGSKVSSAAQLVLNGVDSSLSSRTGSAPLLHNPLASSRRFALLPIQSDRTISEVQLRKFSKDKQENENRQDNSSASGVMKMTTGLGFFSSMLKTK